MACACALLCLTGCGRVGRAPDLPHAPAALSERFYAPRGWTWGRIQLPGGAPLRYGVASPPVVPRGQVLLLPDYGEPAEIWFETANDLLDRGYTVWLLDGSAGKSLAALDPRGPQALTREVIRPTARSPLVVVGQGLGATLALRWLGEARVANVKAALLASPTLDLAAVDLDLAPEQVETTAEWAARLRLGWIPLPGDGQPRLAHIAPADIDPRRAGLAAAWRRSDPALKPRRTTFGWIRGYDQALRAARAPAAFAGSTVPVTMAATAADQRAAAACRRLPTCTLWPVPTTAPHLAPDAMRRAWLDRIGIPMGR